MTQITSFNETTNSGNSSSPGDVATTTILVKHPAILIGKTSITTSNNSKSRITKFHALFVAIIFASTYAILKQHKAAFFSFKKIELNRRELYFDAPSLSEVEENVRKKDILPSTDDITSSLFVRKDQRDAKAKQQRRKKSIPVYPVEKNNRKNKREDKPLNILLLYADDWRHDTLGAAGNPILKTPILDQLARDGVRFTQNCVTTSICWISRATLYSGMYLARHKFEMLGRGRTVNGTEMGYEPPKNETIYALLKHQAQYHVGHAGKLGLWLEIDQHLHLDYFVDEDGWHYRDIGGGKVEHITEKNTADAVKFLDQRPRDKPFFLNVAYFATHAVDGDEKQYMPQNKSMELYVDDVVPIPETATEEAWKKMPYFFHDYNEGRSRWHWRFDTPEKHQIMMKNYYRMASEVDTSVGILLEKLREQNVLDETLIIFTTDNGNFHAEHGLADKWYPHQESIRVPLIIKDPRMSPNHVGTTNDDFTLNIDLAPTILGAAGLEPLPSMMGRDMSILYRDSEEHHTSAASVSSNITSKSRKYLPPAGDGDGKYHTGTDTSWRTEFFYEHPTHTNREFIPASEALVRKDYKYFYWPDFKYEQLFNIRKDPVEMNDLFQNKDYRQKIKEMRKRFRELKKLVHSDHAMIF